MLSISVEKAVFLIHFQDTIDDIQKDIGKRMYEKCLRGQVPDGSSDLLSKNDIVRLKRCIYAQGSAALPPITTHNIQVSTTTTNYCKEKRLYH